MKIPRSLSYSAMALWENNPEEFYIKYLAEHRPPRQKQVEAMVVGSSFDAYCKSMLNWDLFGSQMSPQFEFGRIFEAQVEPHLRDFGLKAGKHVFKCYQRCGAYRDLLSLMQESVTPPRFEFTVEGLIGLAPFLGKPDMYFVLDRGEGKIPCIFDWKVKGYCSKYGQSPSKGYALCLDCSEGKPSRSHGKSHANYLGTNFRGLEINSGYFEFCNSEYADQTMLYGWLLGSPVGDENLIVGIEEMVSKPNGDNPPILRYARHRGRVKDVYQQQLFKRVQDCWSAIATGWVFQDISKPENDERCEALEAMCLAMKADKSEDAEWMSQATRPQRFR